MRSSTKFGLIWIWGLLALTACGGQETPPAGTAATAPAATAAAPAAPGSWTPEALEELLAPIALYPDVVLGHVLSASTNPQEVLDAGNWLIENQNLDGATIDKEAGKLGLSPSVRALLQFPEALDMMCMQMDWTTELGQAFTKDQGAVLDAVQRLRAQAKDVGNLQSSPQLKVETESQDGKEVITVDPPSPEVVYVPKYDPQAVYAPPPATIPPPTTLNVVPAAGTTTTVTQAGTTTTVASTANSTSSDDDDDGHSTGTLVTTGLLAFGAGILVNEVFDDDDWDDYGPNYYHGGMYYGGSPYYPPPPYMYRPPYGNGYYPSHGYNRPANYQRGFNNNTIIVNDGSKDYWNRNRNGVSTRPAQSPITKANPRRNDLNDLNRQSREREQGREGRQADDRREVASRDAKPGSSRDSGYAGARPENRAARDKMVAKSPPAGVAQDLPTRPRTEYKGATNRPANAGGPGAAQRPASASRPASRDAAPQRQAGAADRGRSGAEPPAPTERPQPSVERGPHDGARQASAPRAAPAERSDQTAFGGGGAQGGRGDRKASQRGRSSMGGGGGHKPRKPRK